MSKNEQSVKKVVGIGASAGGLEALQSLISCIPELLTDTAIVIAQHLSSDYKSMLVELLSRKTKLAVEHIHNGTSVEPNKIYIAPPSDDVTIKDRTFYLKKPASIGAHPSIDVLFDSLAKQFGKDSAGIVLSGTGKDGARGITVIHNAGGVTIAQDPVTAKYEGMPQAACNTGLIDHVLAPEKIGEHLPELLERRNTRQSKIKLQAQDRLETFPQIFELLEQRIGIDFSEYKTSTLVRRLNKRITERRFENEDEYLDYIRQHPEELDRLFEEVLIGVTSFFRDPETFEEIRNILIKLVRAKRPGEMMRVWIPGCASGEEAYTYAILFCDILDATKLKVSLQIFATDIDMKALQKARSGQYSAQSVKQVPKKILSQYFKKVNEATYEVNKDVRKLVLFSRHDVTANPPFLRLDFISCRNLLIYFNSDLQKKVLPLFYYALNPKGYLLLGKSENIGPFQNLFSNVSTTHKIFQRKSSEGKLVKFPHLRPSKPKKLVPYSTLPVKDDLTISDMVKETLYNNFDHPFVVVDENMDIVEINGDISLFIKFKSGNASLNITKLIVPQLQIELRAVSSKSVNAMKTEFGNIRKISHDDNDQYVRIIVKPLQYTQPHNPYYLIIFETLKLDNRFLRMSNEVVEDQDNPQALELERELDATKEHMSSLLEELETSNEELQTLNEEIQASNEELQASNEELETSNEELQATNEELQNAYSELRVANQQIEQQKEALSHSAQNLTTLLNNTLVGYILIDRDYQILAANKTAKETYKKMFHVKLKEDSSFIKVLPDNLFSLFHSYFKRAISGEQVVTEEVFSDSSGRQRYFDFNYTPVAMNKNEEEARFIAVSFVDITKRKSAELDLLRSYDALNQEKHFMYTLTESMPSFVWTTNQKGSYLYCNNSFLRYVGKDLKYVQRYGLKPFIHADDWEATSEAWQYSLKSKEHFTAEHRIKHHSGEYRWYLTLAEAVLNDDRTVRMWAGSSTEIESLRHRQEMEKDVERLKQQRNDLVHVSKIKDQFISLASHQLRTPATAVKQYLGIVMDEYAGPISSEQLQYLQTAYNSNERQLKVINDLLKTAQLDASGHAINKKEYELGELARKVVEESQPMFDLRRQKAVILCKKPVKANFDYEEIKLALTNLLENASKYSYPGTAIEININKRKGYAEISVKDQGVGIDKVHQQRIFEKFTRVENDLSDTVSGTGLGLYWVKRIVKLHNGKISIDSEPKRGSVFRVQLPL